MYYLIGYQWRRRGMEWTLTNEAIKGTPEEWLIEKHMNSSQEEYNLTFVRRIDKDNYEKLREWL